MDIPRLGRVGLANLPVCPWNPPLALHVSSHLRRNYTPLIQRVARLDQTDPGEMLAVADFHKKTRAEEETSRAIKKLEHPIW